jgi:hypothetical protein
MSPIGVPMIERDNCMTITTYNAEPAEPADFFALRVLRVLR